MHLAGGVNSPVRAYRDYDFAPPFIKKASGVYLFDEDGNRYIDYVASFGPMILGHANPAVVTAVKEAVDEGLSFGAPTERETILAGLVKEAFPSIGLLRFVNSGTEAVMSAVRLARGFTGRDKIIKFNGCYHGHSDYLLVKAGSGNATFSMPDSSGVPDDFAKYTLVAEYNDLKGVEEIVDQNKNDIAAIIIEPIAGNMGCVPPKAGFLKGLRDICSQIGACLIFDEVITGFRVAHGGAQELYGVTPDLTCLGKILGGGLPVGAYGGRREIMEMVSPLGPVYQAGTLSGNPLSMAAGIATLSELKKNLLSSGERQEKPPLPFGERAGVRGVYQYLNTLTTNLTENMSKVLTDKDIPHTINRVGSMFSIFFTPEEVKDFRGAEKSDRNTFDRYFIHMLNSGIYLAPSPFETSFVSIEHTDKEIEATINALERLKG